MVARIATSSSHFGTANQLVQSYIQGMDYQLSLPAKMYLYASKFSKKAFFWLGLIFAIIIALIITMIKSGDADAFDYSKSATSILES